MRSRFICWVSGHRYRVLQRFSKTSRRVKCMRCAGDWGMNDEVKAFVDWDSDLEQMYHGFGHAITEARF